MTNGVNNNEQSDVSQSFHQQILLNLGENKPHFGLDEFILVAFRLQTNQTIYC